MTNATEIVLQILKQKSQRVLFSGIVVTFVKEFVDVMKESRGIYKKLISSWFCLEHPSFDWIRISKYFPVAFEFSEIF